MSRRTVLTRVLVIAVVTGTLATGATALAGTTAAPPSHDPAAEFTGGTAIAGPELALAPSATPGPAVVSGSRGPLRTTTLSTGDTVTVTGGLASVKAGAGRAGVTFLTRRVGGRLRAMPSDMLALVQAGRVDPAQFEVDLPTGGSPAPPPAETPGHDVTVVHTGRDGAPATEFETVFYRLDAPGFVEVPPGTPTQTVAVPAGRYAVLSKITGATGDTTMLIDPAYEVAGARRIAIDARLGRPVTVTVPNPRAEPILAYAETLVLDANGGGIGWGLVSTSFARLYTAQLGGGDVPADTVVTQVGGVWTDGSPLGSPYAYRLNWYQRDGVPRGFTRRVATTDLATVRSTYHSAVPGAEGWAFPGPHPVGFTTTGSWTAPVGFPLPAVRTEYVNSEPDMYWLNGFADGETWFDGHTMQLAEDRYTAGRTYERVWNRAVFGPSFGSYGLPSERSGNTIWLRPLLYADGSDRSGTSRDGTMTTELYRNGVRVADPSKPGGPFTVPPGAATYRAAVEAERGAPHELATKTSLAWSFESGQVDGARPLPLSVVRFSPRLDPYNAAPSGRSFDVPVSVDRQPGSTAGPVASLIVSVSYDDGATWRQVPVRWNDNSATIRLDHPAGAGHVSLRATATDTRDNTVELTVIRAYRLAA
jgi:hypothetical protein